MPGGGQLSIQAFPDLNGQWLDLIMVKQIMERFSGKVSLTSRENEGTSVRLSFRVAEPMQQASEVEVEALKPSEQPA